MATHTEDCEGWLDKRLEDPEGQEQAILRFRKRVGARDPPVLRPKLSQYSIMAVATESFLHLSRPLAPAVIGVQPTTTPLNVVIQPQV
jgi:hypothetical protein